MAISGHKQLATLQQYVKPSQDAVAKLMAATDPDRRRRVTVTDSWRNWNGSWRTDFR
jgi:hypothetical protein